MAASAVGGVSVVIDPQVWYRTKKELDAFDPALSRALRRRIKASGDVAAEKVRQTLRMSSPDGGPNTGRSRAALIAATKVRVSFQARQAGAKITTSGSGLPAGHEGLLMVYNKDSFRHPVFGDRDDWVQQQGRPYFGRVIAGEIRRHIVQKIHDAIDEAMAAVASR
ncbi:hypothetical protein [Herbiconiux sp. VKM Ac-2851]|uniref:hypothetical protein n=1 Tax=Herbiconiux sp. VKM Ac-2851 TaxID=2739025 RepID=UPI001563C1F1|nr:hypothetical protein [Herbiconiux sp. VKM Ac-2851]NQX36250.1 hypothetical protein [Herbiconiux sp. VKM Ac-2851]